MVVLLVRSEFWVILGLYWDNGKQNENDCLGFKGLGLNNFRKFLMPK